MNHIRSYTSEHLASDFADARRDALEAWSEAGSRPLVLRPGVKQYIMGHFWVAEDRARLSDSRNLMSPTAATPERTWPQVPSCCFCLWTCSFLLAALSILTRARQKMGELLLQSAFLLFRDARLESLRSFGQRALLSSYGVNAEVLVAIVFSASHGWVGVSSGVLRAAGVGSVSHARASCFFWTCRAGDCISSG